MQRRYPGAEFEMAEVEAAWPVIGLHSQKVIAGDAPALETAFATISQMRVDAVTVGTDGFFIARREQIAALARSSSSWSSTSRPRKRSASQFRRQCLPAPTRSSNSLQCPLLA